MRKFAILFFTVFLCGLPSAAMELADVVGNYEVVVDTPLGKKDGSVIVTLDGTDGFKGSITLFDNENDFSGGVFDGKNFSFSGKMKFGIFRIQYTAHGTFENGKIDAVANTKVGDMKIVGKKID